jgi:hypothetical protein
MKKLTIYAAMFLLTIGIVLANGVSVSTNLPVSSGDQLHITATVDSQSVNLWKVKDISVPSGWVLQDRQFSGASGVSHNELCGVQDNGLYACSMLADSGSTAAKSVTLIYTVSSSVDSIADFSAKWETYSGGQLTDMGNIGNGASTPSSGSSGLDGSMIFIIGAVAVGLFFLMNKK